MPLKQVKKAFITYTLLSLTLLKFNLFPFLNFNLTKKAYFWLME